MQFETLIGESGKANQKFLFRSENSSRCRKNGSFVGCDLSSEPLLRKGNTDFLEQ